MKIVMISDVHCKWDSLVIPECDVLISCGDYSFRGEREVVRDFHTWLNEQEANHIISLQGNHELWVEKNFNEAKELALSVCPAVHFIDEGPIEIEGVRFYGSAVQPTFGRWAWNRDRGPDIKRHWDRIPDNIQVLITHGPPGGILDVVYDYMGTPNTRVGCNDLMDRIRQLNDLKLHCFGHIHESSGIAEIENVTYVNAAICNDHYAVAYPVREYLLTL